jgi:RNA polymerase sigma factor (TIGR02999 family)
MNDRTEQVTLLLSSLQRGDAAVAKKLLPLVYEELRARAGKLMSAERRDHTLQRTALVHEAYLRLVRPGADFESRLHFFNAAALAMRRILFDHADARRAQKRGGGRAVEVSLDDVDAPDHDDAQPTLDMIALDDAMKTLEKRSPRQHQVVMLRFFACLKDADIAELLAVSEKTVRRDWATARLWLHAEMNRE